MAWLCVHCNIVTNDLSHSIFPPIHGQYFLNINLSKTKLQDPSGLVVQPEGMRPFVTGVDGVDFKVAWSRSM
jgi:hypothetical protein